MQTDTNDYHFERNDMQTAISFFNNKGGVGKTTLACNFAAYAHKIGYSVTVVDCDPQANATQLLLTTDDWESIYTADDQGESQSILEPLKIIRDGDSSIHPDIPIVESKRFGVNVLPGHPALAQVEDIISSAWGEFRGNAEGNGGARRTLWAKNLRKHINSDLIVFDMSPSLGALNRSVLIGSDYFVTPVEADLFSLYALENIGTWLSKWTKDFERASQEYVNTNVIDDLRSALQIRNGWTGYTVQQYVSRTSAGVIRNIKSYDRYKSQIPERAKGLEGFKSENTTKIEIGIVPNMFAMIPMAQAAHSPISDLKKEDGLRGTQPAQRDKYVEQLDAIFANILANMGLKNA
jgi:cobyrinic acid ac-diamide synthase